MKRNNVFWGIIFIAIAVIITLDSFGYIPINISVWQIILGFLFVSGFIHGLRHLDFYSMLFSLAFLGITFDKELHIEQITPWPILGIALLLSIGLSMIFSRNNFCFKVNSKKNHKNHTKIDYTNDSTYCSVNFTSAVKYINSDDFTESYIDCSFGSGSIYFDKAVIKGDFAKIHVDVSFGKLELFIPKEWNIINSTDTSFGGIEIKNDTGSHDGPTVTLEGDVSFSGLVIYYI